MSTWGATRSGNRPFEAASGSVEFDFPRHNRPVRLTRSLNLDPSIVCNARARNLELRRAVRDHLDTLQGKDKGRTRAGQVRDEPLQLVVLLIVIVIPIFGLDLRVL